MIYCNKCGFPNNSGNVCGKCGNFLSTEELNMARGMMYNPQSLNTETPKKKLVFNKVHAVITFIQVIFLTLTLLIGLIGAIFTENIGGGVEEIISLIYTAIGSLIGTVPVGIFKIIMGKMLWQQKKVGAIMGIIQSISEVSTGISSLLVGLFLIFIETTSSDAIFDGMFGGIGIIVIVGSAFLLIIGIPLLIYYSKNLKYFTK